MATDDREQRRTAMVLRQEGDFNQAVLQTLGAIVVVLNREGDIVYANEACVALTGYTADELGERPFWEFLLVTDEAEGARQVFQGVMAGEFPNHHENYWRTRKGDLRRIAWSNTALCDADGPVRYVVSSGLDVTEQRLAERQLRESEEVARAIVTTVFAGVVAIDESGLIRLFNAASERLFGWTADEVLGRNVSMLMGAPDCERHDGYIRRYLETSRRHIVASEREVSGLRKDGAEFPMLLAVNEAWSGGRRLFVGTIRDLSLQKQLEQQLLQAQKMEAVGRLAGGVAHDFNNMLAVINGYSQLLQLHAELDPKVQSQLRDIAEAGGRAAKLTRQLLAFSRQQTTSPRTLDLNELVADLGKMLQRLIGEDVILELVPNSGEAHVHADPGQLEQVLMNLVVNARDAMPGGGKLTIETREVRLEQFRVSPVADTLSGDFVLLSVRDTGCGMTREIQAYIFEPFFTTKGPGAGTGLGLSTVYGIVHQNGGHIAVESEPGRGSTFTVYLPRVEPASLSKAATQTAPLTAGAGTLLLVEDEPLVRSLIRQTLRESGYRVLEAANGQAAVEILARERDRIDLLITDVVMPGMGGRELAERAAVLSPNLPVLFMSGYTDDAVLRQGILSADVPFLQKPFAPSAITEKVRELLKGGE